MARCLLPAGRPAPAASPHPLLAAAPQRFAVTTRMQDRNVRSRQSAGRRRGPAAAAAASGSASGGSGAADPDAPATDSPPAEAAPSSQQRGGHGRQRRKSDHPALEAINDATKWAVSAAAFGTLLWRRDLLSAFCVLGSIVAAINCRVSWRVAICCHVNAQLCSAAAVQRQLLGAVCCATVGCLLPAGGMLPCAPLYEHTHTSLPRIGLACTLQLLLLSGQVLKFCINPGACLVQTNPSSCLAQLPASHINTPIPCWIADPEVLHQPGPPL